MISIIAAMTRNRVIGKDGHLPWNIKEEKALFKKITLGSTVIMGRKTFESVGLLKDRRNIIVSRTVRKIDGADVCGSLEEAVGKASGYGTEIFIIGGGEIFAEAIGLADRMYLSYIRKDYKGDTFFPEFDQREWKIKARKRFKDFEQIVYVKKK